MSSWIEDGKQINAPFEGNPVVEAELFLDTRESVSERDFTWLSCRKV